MTTDNCKQFIAEISESQGLNPQDKWKRTRKYKQGSSILREFINNKGNTLTISDDNGVLSLYHGEISTSVKSPVSKKSKQPLVSNWLANVRAHYSHPCYKDEDRTDIGNLEETLATLHHMMQHNEEEEDEEDDDSKYPIKFVTEGSKTFLVADNLCDGTNDKLFIIELDELEKMGYKREKNQSVDDFMEHWNWY